MSAIARTPVPAAHYICARCQAYHLPDYLWDCALAVAGGVLDKAPKWDGHTAQDVVDRLMGVIHKEME